MSTKLDEFYAKLDKLDVNNEQDCLEFAKYFNDEVFKNIIAKIKITENDAQKANSLLPDEIFDINKANDPDDAKFAPVRFYNFLNFEKLRIDRFEKVGKLYGFLLREADKDNDKNPNLRMYQINMRSLLTTAGAWQRDKVVNERIIEGSIQELTQLLESENHPLKKQTLTRSIRILSEQANSQYPMGEFECLSALYLTDNIDNYTLQADYYVGKKLLSFETKQEFIESIANIKVLIPTLPKEEQSFLLREVAKLNHAFKNREGNLEKQHLILLHVKDLEKSVIQSTSFYLQIREAKKHVNKLPEKQQGKGHAYLQSLTDSFHDEKSFEKREIVLNTATKTNEYLEAKNDNNPQRIAVAENNLIKTANQLKHVAHGKKAIGRLLMFVGTMTLVAGAVTAITGGGALLAAAGAGLLAVGKLAVADSKSTMAKPVRQAFFQPAASAEKPIDAPDAAENPKQNDDEATSSNDIPPNMGYGKR